MLPRSPLDRRLLPASYLLALALGLSCQLTSTNTPEATPAMSDSSSRLTPPRAAKRHHDVVSPHGTRADEYYWLRDDTRTDPEVLAYLAAENAYKDSVMAPVKDLEERLFEEIVGRIKQDDETVPYRYRGFYYYSRVERGKEYPIHARRKGSLEAVEEILLDVNQLAEGHGFYRVSGTEVSPDGKLLAYSEDTAGRRQYTLRVKHLAGGELLEDAIPNTSSGSVWADDNRSLFYIDKDPVTLLGTRVKKHVLGTDPALDPVVYEEHDHSFYLGLGRSADERYIVISLESTLSSEVRFLSASEPEGTFRVLVPREIDLEYDADHIGQRWILRTNHQARNFRIVELPDHLLSQQPAAGAGGGNSANESGTKPWLEIVPHDENILLESFQLFDDYLVTGERSGGLQRLQIRPWAGGERAELKFDEAAYSTWIGVNAEAHTPWLRYGYTSMSTPVSTWEVNMKTGERRRLKQKEVPGFNPDDYATERLWAPARDGKRIPVSLVYRKGLKRDGTAPLYQYGYGSYGASLDPEFWSGHVSLLDRGFVFALAHIRGGEEMGRAWYDDGKLLNKKNSFFDFIDVTEFLLQQGYAAASKVVASGGSAGGLLMGAVMNMRPDLYQVVVAEVPFVDVVTTMLDESIPLTTNEFDEWGNPKTKPSYDYMLSYSPYDNVTAQEYPATLVTTGLWDSQVQYFEPAKWVARLRARKTDRNALVFHINMEAGHGGASGRFRSQRELALEFAFVLQQLAMSELSELNESND